MQNNQYYQSFKKGGSAAFLVESTFQLMCAREAIHEFEIEDYHIVMTTFDSYGPRNQQMLDSARKWGLQLDRIDMATVYFEAFLTSDNTLDLSRKRYDRVFLGNVSCLNMLVIAGDYAKKGGVLVAMDDGTATIVELNGFYVYSRPSNDWIALYHWYQYKCFYQKRKKAILRKLTEKGICYAYGFYTIFDDIKSGKYITYRNSFNYLLSSNSFESKNKDEIGIVIIGTIVEELARVYSVEVSYMERFFENKLRVIRDLYPYEKIVYVPHPRDISQSVKNMCAGLSIEYQMLSEPVECYILSHSAKLKSIYGFGSTALIVMKKVLPEVEIIDFEFTYANQKRLNATRKAMNQYYQKSGVIAEQIIIPFDSVRNKDIGVLKNCRNLLSVLDRKICRRFCSH